MMTLNEAIEIMKRHHSELYHDAEGREAFEVIIKAAKTQLPKTEKRWGVKKVRTSGVIVDTQRRRSTRTGYVPYTREQDAREFARDLIGDNDTKAVEVFQFDYVLD